MAGEWLDGWAQWLPIAGFWLLLFALLAGEALLPIHRAPAEPKGRLTANFGLGLLNAALFATLPLSSVLAAEWARLEGVGAMNLLAVPAAAAFAGTVLIRSLSAYALHVAAHRTPLLWRMHRVHHADVAVDLSTGFRHHPLELLFVAAVHGALAALLGLSAAALALYEAAAVALTLWSHANLNLPERLERRLALALVTPTVHHVHHGADRAETDSNYGELLTLWDRLFGTWRRLDGEALAALRIGLGERHDGAAASLVRQLAGPFAGNEPKRATGEARAPDSPAAPGSSEPRPRPGSNAF